MINNSALQNILATCTDWSTVCELYSADTTPTASGFDPNDAIACFAAVGGITFMGVEYRRLVKSYGTIKKSITSEVNTAAVTFSNISREISDYEFNYGGFEGKIMVIRGLSRGQSTTLATSKIEFAGRCDQPTTGDKDSLQVNVKFIVGALDCVVPRRTFGTEDFKGRASTDPEFEGFIYSPLYGSVSFPRIERGGGFLGWWNTRQVIGTLPYSNYSDLSARKAVPEVFGRTQMQGVIIAAADVGTQIRMIIGWCEGPISDVVDYAKSTDPALPLNTISYAKNMGLVGILNTRDTGWPGGNSYYSRTANVRTQADNSPVGVNEPPPDVYATILGKIITTPNSSGVWNTEAWTNNAAAVARHLFTHPDYYNLDPNWIDDAYAYTCWKYNDEYIFNTSLGDFIFLES